MPSRYASAFRSREKNANAPVLDATGLKSSDSRLKHDLNSPWFSPFYPDLSSIRNEHPKKVYVPCGDLDILRNYAIIYEQILRNEGIAETKIDVLKGYDHGKSILNPELKQILTVLAAAWISLLLPQCHSQEMREKTLDGMAWLLGRDWDRSKPLPY